MAILSEGFEWDVDTHILDHTVKVADMSEREREQFLYGEWKHSASDDYFLRGSAQAEIIRNTNKELNSGNESQSIKQKMCYA